MIEFWVYETLREIRDYAAAKVMTELAEALDDAIVIAGQEIVQMRRTDRRRQETDDGGFPFGQFR
jgi:hypothetical protein